MKRFELIEHTADIGIKACGKTLAGAFANAAYGMFSIIAELDNVREIESRRVEVNADDIEGLLFEWLNGLLYYFDVETLLFRKFDIIEFGDTRLAADCHGKVRYLPPPDQDGGEVGHLSHAGGGQEKEPGPGYLRYIKNVMASPNGTGAKQSRSEPKAMIGIASSLRSSQ